MSLSCYCSYCRAISNSSAQVLSVPSAAQVLTGHSTDSSLSAECSPPHTGSFIPTFEPFQRSCFAKCESILVRLAQHRVQLLSPAVCLGKKSKLTGLSEQQSLPQAAAHGAALSQGQLHTVGDPMLPAPAQLEPLFVSFFFLMFLIGTGFGWFPNKYFTAAGN